MVDIFPRMNERALLWGIVGVVVANVVLGLVLVSFCLR